MAGVPKGWSDRVKAQTQPKKKKKAAPKKKAK